MQYVSVNSYLNVFINHLKNDSISIQIQIDPIVIL